MKFEESKYHTIITNYTMTVATVIKPFTNTYDYKHAKILSTNETYIKVKGIKHLTCKKSTLGYQVSNSRTVGPCIYAMGISFEKLNVFNRKVLKFISDSYSVYLSNTTMSHWKGLGFNCTQVIGLQMMM